MITTSVNNTTTGNQSPKKALALKPEDFIKMMITQLQNQDPLQPAKNEELLAQMSQIGQLQSSTQLQDSLQKMVVQNQIGSASSLIGKFVQGLSDDNKSVSGTVSSIRVEDNTVRLELDDGTNLPLGNVITISPVAEVPAS
jgi:flagellar basal-body rod modification protein FlgD